MKLKKPNVEGLLVNIFCNAIRDKELRTDFRYMCKDVFRQGMYFDVALDELHNRCLYREEYFKLYKAFEKFVADCIIN